MANTMELYNAMRQYRKEMKTAHLAVILLYEWYEKTGKQTFTPKEIGVNGSALKFLTYSHRGRNDRVLAKYQPYIEYKTYISVSNPEEKITIKKKITKYQIVNPIELEELYLKLKKDLADFATALAENI